MGERLQKLEGANEVIGDLIREEREFSQFCIDRRTSYICWLREHIVYFEESISQLEAKIAEYESDAGKSENIVFIAKLIQQDQKGIAEVEERINEVGKDIEEEAQKTEMFINLWSGGTNVDQIKEIGTARGDRLKQSKDAEEAEKDIRNIEEQLAAFMDEASVMASSTEAQTDLNIRRSHQLKYLIPYYEAIVGAFRGSSN